MHLRSFTVGTHFTNGPFCRIDGLEPPRKPLKHRVTPVHVPTSRAGPSLTTRVRQKMANLFWPGRTTYVTPCDTSF